MCHKASACAGWLLPLTAAAWLGLALAQAAKPWSVGRYPVPNMAKGFEACGRSSPTSLLCDPDGLLTAAEADQAIPPLTCKQLWLQHVILHAGLS